MTIEEDNLESENHFRAVTVTMIVAFTISILLFVFIWLVLV